MGVDAIMLAKVLMVLSKEDVLALAVDCYEALGPDTVWVDRPIRHCIAIDNDGCWHLPAKENETWLSIYLGGNGRYYGPGYERGHLHKYISIAEWLEERIPNCQIFYGGDSGDYV